MRRQLKLDKDAYVLVEKIKRRQSRADRLADAASLVGDAKGEVESLKQELEDWRDNMPESLQGGSKHDELEEAISELLELEEQLEQVSGFDNVNFPGMR